MALASEVLYARDDLLFAFEAGLRAERGRVPGDEAWAALRLAGTGTLVLRVGGELACVRVTVGRDVYAEPGALCAWTGGVRVRVDEGKFGPFMRARGEGLLLVEAAAKRG
jgi:uncharacterized protein (AIM24 family)